MWRAGCRARRSSTRGSCMPVFDASWRSCWPARSATMALCPRSSVRRSRAPRHPTRHRLALRCAPRTTLRARAICPSDMRRCRSPGAALPDRAGFAKRAGRTSAGSQFGALADTHRIAASRMERKTLDQRRRTDRCRGNHCDRLCRVARADYAESNGDRSQRNVRATDDTERR